MRYFFDLKDGGLEEDTTGTELPDMQAAQAEAIRFAGEVLKNEPHKLEQGTMRVDVHDAAGNARFTVEVFLRRE